VAGSSGRAISREPSPAWARAPMGGPSSGRTSPYRCVATTGKAVEGRAVEQADAPDEVRAGYGNHSLRR